MAHGLRNTRGEGDGDAGRLNAGRGIVAAQPAHVGGVRQHTPGQVLEALPLLGKVVADVIAHLADDGPMRAADLAQVRRV